MVRFGVSICCAVIFVVDSSYSRAMDNSSSSGDEEIFTSQVFSVATTPTSEISETPPKTRYEQGLEDYDEAQARMRQSRGMMMDDEDDHHLMDDHHNDMPEQKAVKEDPWASYYDFIITEGSFKFWAVFQLVTALLLVYSAFAAVYYAKFNVITTDYDYYDDFFARSNTESSSSSLWSGLSSQTFQRIFDALSSKKYS